MEKVWNGKGDIESKTWRKSVLPRIPVFCMGETFHPLYFFWNSGEKSLSTFLFLYFSKKRWENIKKILQEKDAKMNNFYDCMVVGDLHSSPNDLFVQLEKTPASIILQTGDFGFSIEKEPYSISHFEKQLERLSSPPHIFFCDGNHEDWPALSSLLEMATPTQLENGIQLTKHITWMPRGSRLTLSDGRVVLFLGGAKSVDWRMSMIFQREKFLINRKFEVLHKDDLPLSALSSPCSIIVSHTAPASLMIPGIDDLTKQQIKFKEKETGWDLSEDNSRNILDEVLKQNQPEYWFCGHFHTSFSEKKIIEGKETTFTVLNCSTGENNKGFACLFPKKELNDVIIF